MVTCQNCFRTFHLSCLQHDDYNAYIKNKGLSYQCVECKFRMNQMYQIGQRVLSNGSSSSMFTSGSYGGIQVTNDTNKQSHTSGKSTSSNSVPSLNGANEVQSLLYQVLQNTKMTNEERLLFILKNNKNIRLHPYIMQVLNNRENMKKGFGYVNNYNFFKNSHNNGNKIQNGYMNNGLFQGEDNDSKSQLKKKVYQYNGYINNGNLFNGQPTASNNMIGHNFQKFPIDDVLLFESPERYEINLETMKRPQGELIDIPYDILNKLVIVWDFLKTFHDSLCGIEVIQYEVNGNLKEFYNDLSNQDYFKNILISFLFLSVKNLKILDTNLIDKEVYIVKGFLENPNSSPYSIFADCLCEILRIISKCGSYRYLVNNETQEIICSVLENYSLDLPNDKKIILLNTFVAISYETIIIKGQIKGEYEKSSTYSIEKTNLEEALKESEKRKKEIVKNEKFNTLGTQIEELQKKLDELKKKEETPEIKKAKGEIEIKKAKYQSIIRENDNLDERKKDIMAKIQKTKDKIQALRVPRKRLLGTDYKKKEYYYFNSSPGQLYVKDKKEKNWYLISKKEDIQELLNKLSEKGIRERKLKYYLKRVIHDIEMNEEQKRQKNEEKKEGKKKDNLDPQNNMKIEKEESTELNSNNNKTIENNKENINKINEINEDSEEDEKGKATTNQRRDIKRTANEILLKMEQKFSEYLRQFNKEWENEENRQKWKKIIAKTENEQNFISTLKMFNHRFKNPYKSDIEDEENEESEEKVYQIPDSMEKYIFINEKNEQFIIYETDPMKVLSPKVKIWPKDIEINEVDKYYTSVILKNITNKQKLNFALHFYEDVIFSLIKRRETKKYGHNNMMNNLLPVEVGKR